MLNDTIVRSAGIAGFRKMRLLALFCIPIASCAVDLRLSEEEKHYVLENILNLLTFLIGNWENFMYTHPTLTVTPVTLEQIMFTSDPKPPNYVLVYKPSQNTRDGPYDAIIEYGLTKTRGRRLITIQSTNYNTSVVFSDVIGTHKRICLISADYTCWHIYEPTTEWIMIGFEVPRDSRGEFVDPSSLYAVIWSVELPVKKESAPRLNDILTASINGPIKDCSILHYERDAEDLPEWSEYNVTVAEKLFVSASFARTPLRHCTYSHDTTQLHVPQLAYLDTYSSGNVTIAKQSLISDFNENANQYRPFRFRNAQYKKNPINNEKYDRFYGYSFSPKQVGCKSWCERNEKRNILQRARPRPTPIKIDCDKWVVLSMEIPTTKFNETAGYFPFDPVVFEVSTDKSASVVAFTYRGSHSDRCNQKSPLCVLVDFGDEKPHCRTVPMRRITERKNITVAEVSVNKFRIVIDDPCIRVAVKFNSVYENAQDEWLTFSKPYFAAIVLGVFMSTVAIVVALCVGLWIVHNAPTVHDDRNAEEEKLIRNGRIGEKKRHWIGVDQYHM